MTIPPGHDHRRPTSLRRALALTAATLLAGAVVAGCGDDDGDETSAPEPETTTGASDAAGSETDAPASGPVEIEIINTAQAYEPSSATASVGTEVVWTNTDDLVHTATAEDGTWDSGDIEPEGQYTFTPEEPGTYAYVCTIHPTMRGEIVVE